MHKYLQTKAPFNGIITARTVNPGAYVGPPVKGSELPSLTLLEQKKLRLVISVPEAYTSYINTNNEVDFTVKALPDLFFKARVKKLAGKKMAILRSMAG